MRMSSARLPRAQTIALARAQDTTPADLIKTATVVLAQLAAGIAIASFGIAVTVLTASRIAESRNVQRADVHKSIKSKDGPQDLSGALQELVS